MIHTDIVTYLFLEHPHRTKHPQTYWEHGAFSVGNSLKLMFFGVLGIIHGFVPRLFPFSTSSAIIRSFCKLVASDRHEEELIKLIPLVLVEQLHRNIIENIRKNESEYD